MNLRISGQDAGGDADDPRLAIRRHTDRCFHRVEEVVPGGYIVEGIMVDRDDVAAVRRLDANGVPIQPERE